MKRAIFLRSVAKVSYARKEVKILILKIMMIYMKHHICIMTSRFCNDILEIFIIIMG